MKPVLVILAAGMGNRYGGLKQLDRVGPFGESLLEYSVYDALRAGFGKIIFVIRKVFETEFRQRISSKFRSEIEVEHVFQEICDLPAGFEAPIEREKPWGTGHAVYAARDVIDGPFGVINADDFYGPSAFEQLAGFLINEPGGEFPSWCLIGYPLKNTLSTFGPVSRAICSIDEKGNLLNLKELTGIERVTGRDIRGRVQKENDNGNYLLEGDETVSMNCFGFTRDFIAIIEEGFQRFLTRQSGSGKTEFYLPEVAGEAISLGKAELRVLPTNEKWHGLTYREDLDEMRAQIAQMVKSGLYPKPLWVP